MRGTKIALLLLILGSGALLELAWDARAHFDDADGFRLVFGRYHGPSFEFPEDAQLASGTTPTIVIDNSYGDVRVTGGDSESVEVSLNKVVFRATEADAREYADRVSLNVREDGERIRVSTSRRHGRRHRYVGLETHLTLRVPRGATVSVENMRGAVKISDVASVDASTSHESLAVDHVSGTARLSNRHGAVVAEDVGGDIDARSHYGDVRLNAVSGRADLDVYGADVSAVQVGGFRLKLRRGELDARAITGTIDVDGSQADIGVVDSTADVSIEASQGEVRLERVAGAATVRATRASLVARDVTGLIVADVDGRTIELQRLGAGIRLTAKDARVEGDDIAGGIEIQSSGNQDVSLEGVTGPVRVDASQGDVTVALAELPAPDAGISLTTGRGSVDLTLPERASFRLDAGAEAGEIEIDAGFDLPLPPAGRDATLVGERGVSGPPIVLRARRGDVRVRGR